MGDSNAWDLVDRTERKKSRSPSHISRVDSEVNLDNAELEALGLGKVQLQEAAREQREHKKRSKSPALENIRKASLHVLQKFGAVPKKKDDSVATWKVTELPQLPLDSFCLRPKEFFEEPKAFSFRDLGLQQQKLDSKLEKCSYLFRGTSLEAKMMESVTETERIAEYDHFCPVHGSRRRLHHRNQLLAMNTLMNSVDDDNLEHLYNHEFVAKLIRKKKREMLSGEEKLRVNKVMRKIRSNLWIISVAFLFLFTGFNGLQNLQTSVNHHLGSDSLAVLYISLAISSLFVPTFMIGRLGCKLTFVVAIFIYILYLLINLRPTYYSLIPGSVLCGVAASCVWGAKCAYITEMGIRYATLNFESQNTVIVRFFGYFFMIVHCGQFVGNMISSFILKITIETSQVEDRIYPTCGYLFPMNASELTELAAANLARPPQTAYIAVCLAYLACAIVSVMIVCLFLNALHSDVVKRSKKPSFNAEIIRLFWQNLVNVRAMLLVPLTIFNGIEQAFIAGVFTKAFVGCGLGIAQIGFILASFGISDAICSFVFGPLIKLFGRMPLFVFGAVVNLLMIVTLMIWPLNAADTQIFYVVAAMWGMADGVWNTQINGFWVALVGRQSLQFAFTKYRFWESFGIAIGFLLLRFLNVELFLLMLFFTLLIGMCGYVAIEMFDVIVLYTKSVLPTHSRGSREPEKSMEQSLITNTTTI
ncbi:unnamed protein product [Caenorhabditis auriculariae]|uniref:Uncharacterized protein n=1 Tax=Caenorhabditis auriculariae TaxID=2777116 RepID=A0A8S1HKL6_9PELO|nr:unnamed protein product [Caenorhabditis auriculariae]